MSCSKSVSPFVSFKKGRVGPTCSGLDPVSSLGALMRRRWGEYRESLEIPKVGDWASSQDARAFILVFTVEVLLL